MKLWIEVLAGDLQLFVRKGSTWRAKDGRIGEDESGGHWWLIPGETAAVIVDPDTAQRLRTYPNVVVLGESECESTC